MGQPAGVEFTAENGNVPAEFGRFGEMPFVGI